MILIPDIRRQLGDVFSPEQADVLTHVVTEAYDTLVTKSDLHELRVVVREMADAQKITNEQLARTGAEDDIGRTARRAAILAKTGRRSIPILACLRIDAEVTGLARERGVWVIRRGRLFNAET